MPNGKHSQLSGGRVLVKFDEAIISCPSSPSPKHQNHSQCHFNPGGSWLVHWSHNMQFASSSFPTRSVYPLTVARVMPGIRERVWGRKHKKIKQPRVAAMASSSSVGGPGSSTDPPKRGRKRSQLGEEKLNPLTLQLKSDFLKKKKDAKAVQAYAEAAESAGARGMATLAAAATQGQNPKNFSRDIGRKLMPKKMEHGPPLYFIEDGQGGKHPMVPVVKIRIEPTLALMLGPFSLSCTQNLWILGRLE